ncbi:MAG: large repetitive protein, partial [Thermoplasmata archaeon]|nr:large repetitive protein [Thermoplasmata archaeon]
MRNPSAPKGTPKGRPAKDDLKDDLRNDLTGKWRALPLQARRASRGPNLDARDADDLVEDVFMQSGPATKGLPVAPLPPAPRAAAAKAIPPPASAKPAAAKPAAAKPIPAVPASAQSAAPSSRASPFAAPPSSRASPFLATDKASQHLAVYGLASDAPRRRKTGPPAVPTPPGAPRPHSVHIPEHEAPASIKLGSIWARAAATEMRQFALEIAKIGLLMHQGLKGSHMDGLHRRPMRALAWTTAFLFSITFLGSAIAVSAHGASGQPGEPAAEPSVASDLPELPAVLYAEGYGTGSSGKVTICHVPPGNPGNAHTLSVGSSAVPAHLAHGDSLGACAEDCDEVDEVIDDYKLTIKRGSSTLSADHMSSVRQGDSVQALFKIDADCQDAPVSLASYTASGPTWPTSLPQTLYDSETGLFDAGWRQLPFVDVPTCYFQADLVIGPVLSGDQLNSGERYGDRKVDAVNGGTAACPDPKTLPLALFNIDCSGVICSFDASPSFDPDNAGSLPGRGIVSYAWTFGDTSSGSGKQPGHTYAANGTFSVKLTVVDDEGKSGSLTQPVTVKKPAPNNIAPFAEFDVDCPALSLACTFDGSLSHDVDGFITAWDWDYGDGDTGNGTLVHHTFPGAGRYFVTLTVTDNNPPPGSGQRTKVVGVLIHVNEPPIALFEFDCSGLDCTFDGDPSFDPDGNLSSFAWQFGDGSVGSGEHSAHSYAHDGSYQVNMTVLDDEGAVDSFSQLIHLVGPVNGNDAPHADFGYDCSGLDCSFNGTASYDTDGFIVKWEWDFADGSNGTGTLIDHEFPAPGIYAVVLTVSDDSPPPATG